ncbi:MAG: AAC(3) family N-acetyltransferase [Anaerolineales bacterium]
MSTDSLIDQFVSDLHNVGVRPGGTLLVHASFKSLGPVPGGVDTIIDGLLEALGPEGTLLMPALSYETVVPERPTFNIKSTPSCVGSIPETFRLRTGTRRSMHPTHSVCAVGPISDALLNQHILDSTPCGPNSPFTRLPDFNGQILMLGCGLQPNTSMHSIEEIAQAPYLFNPPLVYTLIDQLGGKMKKSYSPHKFINVIQRYDRIETVLDYPGLRTGSVLNAKVHLLEASALKDAALHAMGANPCFFVDIIDQAA